MMIHLCVILNQKNPNANLIELRDYLSELLMIKVDIVTPNELKARLRDRVLSEVIYL